MQTETTITASGQVLTWCREVAERIAADESTPDQGIPFEVATALRWMSTSASLRWERHNGTECEDTKHDQEPHRSTRASCRRRRVTLDY